MQRRFSLALIFLVPMIFGSCAPATSMSSTSTLVTTTTLGKDPAQELKTLAMSEGAIDYEFVADDECGDFSILIKKTRMAFLEWVEGKWVDKSALLKRDYPTDAFSVDTFELTNDATPEFLIQYNEGGQQGGHQFGGIFMQVECNWQWAELKGYYEAEQSMDLLFYNESSRTLTAWDYGPEGRSDIVLSFNSATNQFDGTLVPSDHSS